MPAAESSCLDWNDGVNLSGPYPIEVDGFPLMVYCDMTTDGGGWTQLYDQDVAVPPGYELPATWAGAAGVNIDQPNAGHYSILYLIPEFEGATPGFEFFIDWPNDGNDFVRWKQDTNPFVGRDVRDIVQSPTNQVGCSLPFGGLAADGDVFSTMDGTTNVCWWWAIGTSAPLPPLADGIPAYGASDTGSLVATRTRLWVR
jgi:hypothetical protein